MATFLGMHAEAPTPNYEPTIMSESRRTIFCGVIASDKRLATFSGRPPLLNRRHVSTPLPLDLDNETLLADRVAMEAAVQRLDEGGWNTDGLILPSTITRALTILSYIRDAILEIALGNVQDTSTETILYVVFGHRLPEIGASER